VERNAPRTEPASDQIAIAKAHAIHTPALLSIYDVHGLSNRFA
jgi:hypothetical protein